MNAPAMRDLIDLWEEVQAKDAEKNHAIDYYDSNKDMSDKERLDRMVPTELKGKAANPNDSASLGKDGQNKATDNFSDGEKLRELDRLKKSVEVLQRLSHQADLGISKDDSSEIDKIIDGMNKKIDELSDSLVDVV